MRGDIDVNETKLVNATGAAGLRPAQAEEIRAAGMEPGYGSPIGARNAFVVVDELVARSTNLVAGANREGFHLRNVNVGRDYTPDIVADLANAREGDGCPTCGAPVILRNGIEVGNIFKLGTRYTTALGATYLGEDGLAHPIVMGSYGIGVGRAVACIVEAHHDAKGIAWPEEVAPYAAHLVSIGGTKDPRVDEVADPSPRDRPRGRPGDPVGRPRRVARREVHRRRAARHAPYPHRQPALARGGRRGGHGPGHGRAIGPADRGGGGAPARLTSSPRRPTSDRGLPGAGARAALSCDAPAMQRPGFVARLRGGTGAPADSQVAGPTPGPASEAAADVAALVDVVGVGVLRVDPGLVVAAASPAAHALLGRRAGTLAGRSVMEAFTDHRAEELVRRALAVGSATGELVGRGTDAPTLLLRARRTPNGDAWVALEDVTELRRLQRIRAEFIDNLSHELRTPLTTVSLLAETLARDAAGLPPRVAERIGKIEVETGHLVQMVNELLDLAKIESGRQPLVLEDLDLRALAAATIERIALFAERQGVHLQLDAAPAIPHVRGDGARLGQALLNLVHNAVKFSPPGGPVTVRVQAAESEVVVSVEDRGPGIPRSALPRLFERFYKVDRARPRAAGGGTGLGLAIARHVVEAHGGRIWAESEEGSGSTFSFAIPIAGPEMAATPGA